MRVFILSNTLKIGGAEKQSIILAKALQERYETSLIVYYGSEFDQKLKTLAADYGVNVVWLFGSHIKRLIFIYKLFREKKNSTVVFSYLATTNFINAIIGKLAGVKYRIGGIRSSELSKSKFHLQKFLHNHLLTCSVFNNNSGKNNLCSKGFREKRAIVIHNGIDIKMIRKKRMQIKLVINIISVGRFVEKKDYFTSVGAIALLLKLIEDRKNVVEIKYIIVGYGPLEKTIREYISKMNMNKFIDLIINPPEISEYLAQADIYLSTSLCEGMSNSIMEAMEYSLPIVATNVGDNNFLVREGYNGFLVPVKAIKDISERLFGLIYDTSLRVEMGINSYNLIKETYSIEAFKQNYLNFTDKLADESET